MSTFHFGKLPAPAQPHPHAIPFGSIVSPALAAIAPSWDWTWKQGPGNLVPAWPLWGNDTLPDCVFAAIAGLQAIESLWGQRKLALDTDAQVIAAYRSIVGNSNNGVALGTGLDLWKRSGIAGHKILAYTGIFQLNFTHIKQAIFWFGGVDLGLVLPDGPTPTWLYDCDVWDLPPNTQPTGVWAPQAVNGHAVAVVGYDPTGVKLVSWGRVKHASWNWLACYADEVYAALGDLWLTRGTTSPQGMNLPALQQALRAVTN